MTVAHRPRRIRKVTRPLLQWYYNLGGLLPRPLRRRDGGTLPSVLPRRSPSVASHPHVPREVDVRGGVRVCESALQPSTFLLTLCLSPPVLPSFFPSLLADINVLRPTRRRCIAT